MEANLLRRTLAAVVLVPAVVASVLWLPHAWFAGAAALFMAVGSWEWAGLSGRDSTARRVAYTAITLALMLWLSLHLRHPGALLAACAAGAAWWAVALFRVVSAQRGTGAMSIGAPWLHGVLGWLMVVPAFCALVLLHGGEGPGRGWLLLLLAFVWSADIGAYFTGRRFGRRRLASRLSPGKSWEGVLGGAAACLAIGVGVALGMEESSPPRWTIPVLALGVALVSVLGDLLESLVKRQAGVKDSGAFIPGHGGVLDRIDGLCAAAPCFVLALIGLVGTGMPR